jgi:hypothetical protein
MAGTVVGLTSFLGGIYIIFSILQTLFMFLNNIPALKFLCGSERNGN